MKVQENGESRQKERKKIEMARQRLKSVTNTKWFSTAGSVWIQCTSGSLYTFSIYSPILKSTQGYDQSTLDTVSVSKDIGANCGVLSGVLYTFATSDHSSQGGAFNVPGPWVVLLVGAAQSFLGYFLMWAAVSGLIPRPPVAVMCLFIFVAAHAQSFFNTADVVTGVQNFPGYSGTAVGIMKGFVGLSGAILIQVHQTILQNKPASFLLMLAILPSVNTLLLMWFVRIHKVHEENEKKYLDYFSMIALILAGYLMIIIILEELFSFQFFLRIITFVLLIGLVVSPLFVAIRASVENYNAAPGMIQSADGSVLLEKDEPVVYHHLPCDNECDMDINNESNSVESVEQLDLFQAVRRVNFWILFLAMACGMGSGLATVNNMSQVGGSLGYKRYEINTLISLWSIWNFLGRFGAGYISDYFLRARGWARPLFMTITLAGISIGHLVIASSFPFALYAGSILVGLCYGAQWSLMPTIASEIFGVRHMGTIFNTITMAGPIGSYIFSVRVVGYIYDWEASGAGNKCYGNHCFMLSFLIMACATFFGSLAALALFFRTRSFYSRVILRRLLRSARV